MYARSNAAPRSFVSQSTSWRSRLLIVGGSVIDARWATCFSSSLAFPWSSTMR